MPQKATSVEGPRRIDSIMKIEHKDPFLRVARTFITENGKLTTETVYRTDGKETTNKLPGGGEMRNTARWENSELLIETPIALNGNKFTIKLRWKLSQDGKILTAVRTLPDGDGTQTEIFEKRLATVLFPKPLQPRSKMEVRRSR